jgi:peptidoglycan/xylan/chitin deacetylase (PgdA/CDA1 family)
MAMNKSKLWLLPLFFLLSSCQTITSNRTELGIPSSLVYFSFDDGPDARGDTTARLLDVLHKYQIRALFSLLGENAEYYPELVRRIHDEGHYIVNHGYSDKWAAKMNEHEFRDNLVRGEAAISGALGFDMNPRLYRPHGGFYYAKQKNICIEEGFTIVPVTARVYDAIKSGTSQRKIVKDTIKKLEKQNGGVILLHDGRDSHSRREKKLAKNPRCAYNRSWIPETVEEIIIALLDKGFIVSNADLSVDLHTKMPLFN